MIRFKNLDCSRTRSAGFAFAEVLLALLITGMFVSALSFSLSTSMNSVGYAHAHLRAAEELKKFFHERVRAVLEGKDEPSSSKSENTVIKISAKKSRAADSSAFKGLENLSLTTLKSAWKKNSANQEEQLVYLRFKPTKEQA
jgi:hypothetical protein